MSRDQGKPRFIRKGGRVINSPTKKEEGKKSRIQSKAARKKKSGRKK